MKTSEFDSETMKKILSESAKNGWTRLKENEEKYESWRNKRSIAQSNYMKNRSDEDLKKFIEKSHSDSANNKRSETMKSLWSDHAYTEMRKESFKMAFSSEPHREQKRQEGLKRWSSISTNDKNDFDKKMKTVNSCQEKRKKASEKIKALWANPEWVAKRKTQNKRKQK